MTLTLTGSDCKVLWKHVRAVTNDPQDAKRVYLEIIASYEKYGDGAVEEADRKVYFDTTFSRLLANMEFAGKTSEVFVECRENLIMTFRRLGVPVPDLEELADEAIARFWRFEYAEKYNPIRSSWAHYLYTSLSRMVSTYWNRKKRTPTATGFSYQHHSGDSEEGSYLEPYDQGNLAYGPETCLILEETLKDFEEFLERHLTEETEYKKFDDREGGIRTFTALGFPILDGAGEVVEVIPVEKKNGVISKYNRVCVIIPPENGRNLHGDKWMGTKIADLDHAEYAYVVRKGPKNEEKPWWGCHRVELQDGRSVLWDRSNIILERENEVPNPQEGTVVERSLLRLYKLLIRENAQADVIASILKIGDSTVHAWVRTLERLFAEWWKFSRIIPNSQKWKADPQRTCRNCQWEHSNLPELSTQWAYRREALGRVEVIACSSEDPEAEQIEGHWCDLCLRGYMDDVPERSILPFPWDRVRANQRLVDRSLRVPNSSPVKIYNL